MSSGQDKKKERRGRALFFSFNFFEIRSSFEKFLILQIKVIFIMALLRSGRGTSVSSGLSAVSIQRWKSASGAGQEIGSCADGIMIRRTKRVRKSLSSDSSIEEGRVGFPIVSALL